MFPSGAAPDLRSFLSISRNPDRQVTGMQKAKKTAKDDCNCHYTGFHPSLGVLPKRKVKSKELLGQSPSPKPSQATAKPKPKSTPKSKSQTK
jgi:hypothetical protein